MCVYVRWNIKILKTINCKFREIILYKMNCNFSYLIRLIWVVIITLNMYKKVIHEANIYVTWGIDRKYILKF